MGVYDINILNTTSVFESNIHISIHIRCITESCKPSITHKRVISYTIMLNAFFNIEYTAIQKQRYCTCTYIILFTQNSNVRFAHAKRINGQEREPGDNYL